MENAQNHVLGSGRIYFDQFKAGTTATTGERYLGNTPELSTSRSETMTDHYDADNGKRVKNLSVSASEDTNGSLTTDNISNENLALWFAGDKSVITQVVAADVAETFVGVKQGSWYQLGRTPTNVTGVRQATATLVKVGATTVTQEGNYEIDVPRGRIQVLAGAPDIAEDDDMIVTYDVAAVTRNIVVSKGDQIEGALRFVSNNQQGVNRDYYWPRVKLTSDGDMTLKGEDWQMLPFSMEMLRLNDTTELVYIEEVPAAI